jgi:SAM-dependent methyltransferase
MQLLAPMFAQIRKVVAGRPGFCLVCGRPTLFLITDPANLRESAICLCCESISRNRHLAKCALRVLRPRGIRRFRELARRGDLRIYYVGSGGAMLRVWGEQPHITTSEYHEECESGEYCHGVRCENVERLSFPEASFDLVISEDVFEHVADYQQGLWEVHRVLKPGGYHIFTVPFEFTDHTASRFAKEGDEYVPIQPLYTHGDPIRGSIPVFTHFGYDLLEFLRGIGMEATLELPDPRLQRRLGTFGSYTLVTRKL